MNIRLFSGIFLISLGSFCATAQVSALKQFSLQAFKDDSIQNVRSRQIASQNNIPYYFTDEETDRSYLLRTDFQNRTYYKATLNLDAAKTTGAYSLQEPAKGFQLTGKGITCGVWDDGYVKKHIEFGDRILSREGSFAKEHATHVTGIILSAGLNSQAKGMAPEAKAFTYFFGDDLSKMAALATPDQNGLLFSNHSYGTVSGWSKPNGVWTWYGDVTISNDEDYKHGFYNNDSKNEDALAYMAPYYTIVWAAGNDRIETGDGKHPPDCNKGTGYDCIIPDAVAKNIITVGAVYKQPAYTTAASVVMTNFSSWGPTDDGRIKPDLVGAGTELLSTAAAGTNTYRLESGTSMATPNVTGSLMLVQELYGKLHAGKRMKAATLKALAIHTAKEAGAAAGPDYKFGWGLLDVHAASTLLLKEENREIKITENTLLDGQVHEFEILPNANKKITITICWTDPEGTPQAPVLDSPLRMLVNDLDLRLIDEDGTIIFPWILDPTAPQALATQGDNNRDNVEKIEFETPLFKKYKVRVRHKGTLKYGKQDYSLILSYDSKEVSGRTFYWIGGNGSWTDPLNWSLTQGGIPANEQPDVDDHVIFDASSIADNDEIELTQNVNCDRLTWLADKTVKLNMNGYTVAIGNELTITSEKLKTTDGKWILSSLNGGEVNINNPDFSASDVLFQQGNWKLNGLMNAKEITLNSGAHDWSHATVTANQIETGLLSRWDLSNATLSISSGFTLPSATVEFITNTTNIILDGVSQLTWKTNNLNGKIKIKKGSGAKLIGSGSITSIENEDEVELQGTFTFDTVKLLAGSKLKLSNNETYHINKSFVVQSTITNPVTISSSQKAILAINSHQRYCFDNLNVTNVDLYGNAAVSIGDFGAAINSTNWVQQPCSEVLLANFILNYACVGGQTEFIDTSLGNATTWKWDFGDSDSQDNNSSLQNPTHQFSKTGSFTVKLTIAKGTQEHSYSSVVEVEKNTMEENTIAQLTSDQLISVNTATKYQWYVNQLAMDNKTERILPYDGSSGNFQVVTFGEKCNRISTPFVISGIENKNYQVSIIPNPARDYFMLSGDNSLKKESFILVNSIGVAIRDIKVNEPCFTGNLPDGLYIVCGKSGGRKSTIGKLIIMH